MFIHTKTAGVMAWILRYTSFAQDEEASLGVERQFVTCFWRLTPLCNLFLAFNSRMQHGTGVERKFASSKLEQSMDYYIFLESPKCLLSNAVVSTPFGVL